MNNTISVKNLKKVFNVPIKQEGLLNRFIGVFYRKWEPFIAVNEISFYVKQGEFLGYLGPNGSGKTTTIKMLSGVLTPNDGKAKCLGFTPWRRKHDYLRKIGVLFGNRSNLIFDISLIESFLLYKDMYNLSDEFYEKRMKIFTELLDLKEILHIPVRKLSFGQRMRGELGVVFLHKPELVFLDEPTIGMDPLVKEKIHIFLRQINKQDKVTIVLTTHNIDDIEELCKRVIIMDKGNIVFNGSTDFLKKKYIKFKRVSLNYLKINNKKIAEELNSNLVTFEKVGTGIEGKLPITKQKQFFNNLSNAYEILELTIEGPKLEEIIKVIYRKGN
jgi:ABC-2 type transport system ATP-binding protein